MALPLTSPLLLSRRETLAYGARMNLNTPKHKAIQKLEELRKTEEFHAGMEHYARHTLEFVYGLMDALKLPQGWQFTQNPHTKKTFSVHSQPHAHFTYLATVRIGDSEPPLVINISLRLPTNSYSTEGYTFQLGHIPGPLLRDLQKPDALCQFDELDSADLTPSKDTLAKAEEFIEGCSFAILKGETHRIGKTY